MNKVESDDRLIKTRKSLDKYDKTLFLKAIQETCQLMLPFIVLYVFSYAILNFPLASFRHLITEGRLSNIGYIIRFANNIFCDYVGIVAVISLTFCFAHGIKVQPYRNVVMVMTAVCVYCILVHNYNPAIKDIPSFGISYLFTALISSYITGSIFKIAHRKFNGTIRLKYKKKALSRSLSIAFNDMPIVLILLAISFLISELCMYFGDGYNFQGLIVMGLGRLVVYCYNLNDLLGALAYSILCIFFWFIGMNGEAMLPHESVIPSVTEAVYVIANTNIERTHIVSDQFIHNYVFLGGAGCGLALSVAILIKSKSVSHRSFGAFNLPFTAMGIADIIHYTIPVIFNFVLFIPFFIIPIINTLIAYLSIYLGFVPMDKCSLFCTTPIFFNAYKSTGSFSAVILQVIILIIDTIIYIPFIEKLNNQKYVEFRIRIEQLIAYIKANDVKNINLIELDGPLGDTSRILLSELATEVMKKKNLTPEAYKAIGEHLYMVYHPQCDDSGEYVCSEALLRWEHPIIGLVFPPLIIELARSGGILHELESVILDETCRSISNIEKISDISPKISANIVSASLAHPDFLHMIMKYTRKYHIQNENLWIEMNEQDMMHIDDDVKQKLSFLRKRGHKFIIDDFGAEGTSIVYAGSGLFDGLKIDGSLIKNMFNDKDSYELVKSIANMGVKLNLLLLSEFVENEEEMEALKEMYINLFQGYFYSKTLKYDELIDFVIKEKGKN